MNDTSAASRLPDRPNFLVLLVDEERYPPVYETEELREWRQTHLAAHKLLRQHGLEFHRHYIGSTACCPSRATVFTGQYPSLHGVSQTDGIAKLAFDSNMFWLNRNTVPTMGNYFREAGYQTYYKGKWHISYEDIVVPGTHKDVPSYNPLSGVPDPAKERLYLDADPLESYGFSGWVGPEPHGRNPRNSASSASVGVSGRDVVYASEAVQLIEALDASQGSDPHAAPWLIVASFLNPHDIVLYGDLTERIPAFHFEADAVPFVPPPPTINEPLTTKPRCQASYRNTYPLALQPITNEPFYRRLYYKLQQLADEQMHKVFEALTRSSFYDNTIVIFTSDHGDLLGSHSRLHQKFYCAYEEMLHVPFIIHNRRLFPQPQTVHGLTSHVDLLPTMLGLANIDVEHVQNRLRSKFCEVHPLVGRNLASVVTDPSPANSASVLKAPLYFMTEDDVTRGQHQISPIGVPYKAVVQPNHIETVIATLSRNGREETWKLSRYFDNPDFWSVPGVRDVIVERTGGSITQSIKTVPLPDEYELYNLTDDPLEIHNLAHPAYAAPHLLPVQQQMLHLLAEQRAQKRLTPTQAHH
ncbi:sulfatase-like hydrolase/transferase [Paenibacillus cremeus]|uniref:Sulfatase-like hydrolase/transferase n=1 Tax=Paenibacillus cremeus TaxID=2163881 RepID=A0A559KHY5_9BACL|nr:sulfatase-like hydrolase/transferase [Paenibacillus cremeus]TVY11744.1 sulfatase-like hydrolase/transferase [Paenibacillus cremeus]